MLVACGNGEDDPPAGSGASWGQTQQPDNNPASDDPAPPLNPGNEDILVEEYSFYRHKKNSAQTEFFFLFSLSFIARPLRYAGWCLAVR